MERRHFNQRGAPQTVSLCRARALHRRGRRALRYVSAKHACCTVALLNARPDILVQYPCAIATLKECMHVPPHVDMCLNLHGHRSVSAVRMAQMAALKLPLVGMAAAYDYGDSKSPLGNIHPEFKAPVGERLAWGARALAYGEKVPYENPMLVSATMGLEDTNTTTITLKFSVPVEIRHGHVGFFDASIAADSKAWLSVNGANVTKMAINADGDVEVTTPTSALLPLGKQMTPRATEDMVSLSASLEYLQGDWPIPIFYAKGSGVPGLPAAPFITTTTAANTTASRSSLVHPEVRW